MDDRWWALYVWIVHPQEMQIAQAIRLISGNGKRVDYALIHRLRSQSKPVSWKRIAAQIGVNCETLRASYHKWRHREATA